MQIIYVTMCMISLILYLALGLPQQEQQFKIDRQVLAAHMTAWHKGAVRRCVESSCTAVVDPTAYLFPSMKVGTAFSKDRFTTRYDATTKALMTSVNAGVPASTGLSYDVIMSGLNEKMGGESSMIGIFDKGTSKVRLTALTGIYDKKIIDVPSGIAAGMTDGTPVIVSHM
ncbi:hypothetical protein HFO56_02535 [Rhizobium laguerreae]|uniref:hypothetical protein n=1 Tax=Rhizobium laguerreae TaxID=1076926 RepID=UPI001C927748|nr:hypothetical protein [Rhizobium laguerreae]MBY3151262.1 hypothetical protein [Rhizobium laguerreae]